MFALCKDCTVNNKSWRYELHLVKYENTVHMANYEPSVFCFFVVAWIDDVISALDSYHDYPKRIISIFKIIYWNIEKKTISEIVTKWQEDKS